MLLAVFRDLKPFMLLFGIVIIFFTAIFTVLLNDDLSNYDGLGPIGYLFIAIRESIGDFDTNDSIINNSDLKIHIWIVYLMVMIVGNVVFMNFIIAVVSQSYENCMQKNIAQSYKNKIHMIRERESMMSEYQFKNKNWFPNFIILCKPLSEGSDYDGGNMDNEWNGVLKEIEKVVKSQIDASNQHQKKTINTINEKIEKLNNEFKKQGDKMEKKIEEIDKKFENSNVDKNQRMDHMNKKMDNRNDVMESKMDNTNNKMDEMNKMIQEIKDLLQNKQNLSLIE